MIFEEPTVEYIELDMIDASSISGDPGVERCVGEAPMNQCTNVPTNMFGPQNT